MIEEYSNENCLLRKAQIERMKNLQLPTWEQHFNTVHKFLSNLGR